ncbi:MAG: DUF4870 domain-containing protein [Actinomycetales bacterium]|nr:DUF4870 domain-containing protein [Actinomycetales bacterium]
MAPAPPLSPADEKLWATLVHVGGLFLGVLAPLVVYLVLRDRGSYVRWHAAQALNFHITALIGYAISVVLSFVLIGLFTSLAIWVLVVVFGILATIAANRGEWYRYPLTINFVN